MSRTDPRALVFLGFITLTASLQPVPASPSDEGSAVRVFQAQQNGVLWTVDRVGSGLEVTPHVTPGDGGSEMTSQQSPFASLPGAAGAGADNVQLVGHVGGSVETVAFKDQFALMGEGLRMVVLDLTNPADPVVVAKTEILDGVVEGIAIVGNLAYVAAGDAGLRVVDITNPAAPTGIGSAALPVAGSASCLAVGGTHAFVGMNGGGLVVYDVSNPSAPFFVTRLDPPGAWGGVYYDLEMRGDYVYAGDWGVPGLRVIDVFDPTAPVEVGYYASPSSIFHVALDTGRDYAYAAYGGGLIAIDILDPADPSAVGFLPTNTPSLAVASSGSYAYLGEHDWDLHVIDVSDPNAPVVDGVHDMPWKPDDAAVDGDRVLVAAIERGLRLIDVTNPAAPFEEGFYQGPSTARGVAVVGSYAYTANNKGGFWSVDVTQPWEPVGAGVYNTPGYAGNVDASGDVAVVADNFMGLRVIDIADPTDPDEVGSYNTPGSALDVDMEGGYAYVADFSAGLQIVDISNPNAPFPAGVEPIPDYAMGVAALGDYAYVAAQEAGLRIIDVSDPANAFEVGFQITANARDVQVVGNTAYVGDFDTGLRVIDVTDPSNPSEIGFDVTPGPAVGVAVDGPLAYVAADYAGLRVIDLNTYQEAGFYETPSQAFGVTVGGGFVYVATHRAGLLVLSYGASDVADASLPSTGRLGVSPNPLGRHDGRVAFTLPQDGAASVTIFDVAGRRVRLLQPWRELGKGRHELIWNGRDDAGRPLSPGVYFVKLQTETKSRRERVILVHP